MKAEEISETLLTNLEKIHAKGRIVAIEHLRELVEEIQIRWPQHEISEDLKGYISDFTSDFSHILKDAQSLIIVTATQPRFEVIVHFDGKPQAVTIPPTYLLYTDRDIVNILEGVLSPQGYHITRIRLPQKLLAVRSGLAEYGKNNITYVHGMGSFHRPVAFLSDLPCAHDSWQEVKMMETCNGCSACTNACPTGAIDSEQFLLNAERCLTLHNELPGEFPDWIDPDWHNSLVGCMTCQSVCPANRDVRELSDMREEFSEEETIALLNCTGTEDIPSPLMQKLEQLDIIKSDYFDVLPRNLRAVLKSAII